MGSGYAQEERDKELEEWWGIYGTREWPTIAAPKEE